MSRTCRTKCLFLFLIWGFFSTASASVLTKKEAFDLLKKNGFKWKMTETLTQEAHGKLLQQQSEQAFRAEFVARQYAAKINPAQYGLENKVNTDLVGVGSTGLAFSYSLYDPVGDLKVFGAAAQEKLSVEQSHQYQHDLTALMLIQYAQVQKLERQLKASEIVLEKAELIQKLAEVKVKVGAGISSELLKARSLFESESIKKMNIEIKLSKARHELNQTLGLTHDQLELEKLIENHHDLPGTEQKDLDFAHAQRADFRMANIGAQSAAEASDKLDSKFWPKITLVGDVGTTQTTLFGMPVRVIGGLVGVNLTIPLESGGFLEGKRAETLALKLRSHYNLQQSETDLQQQVREAREQWMAAEKAIAASAKFSKLMDDEFLLAQKKYKAGSMSSLDVANAHSNFGSALDLETEALFAYEAAQIQYYKAIGNFEGYFK